MSNKQTISLEGIIVLGTKNADERIKKDIDAKINKKFQIKLSNGEAIIVYSPSIDDLLKEIDKPTSIGYLTVGDNTYINASQIASIRQMQNWE